LDIDYQVLKRTFLEESEEALARMEGSLLSLEEHPEDKEAVGEVFRVVHTLKGDAGMVGFAAPAAFAHQIEDLLDLIREGQAQITGGLVTLLLQSADALRELLREAEAGRDSLRSADHRLLRGLAAEVEDSSTLAIDDMPTSPEVKAAMKWRGERPGQDRASTLRVDVEKLDLLLTLAGEIAVARGRIAQMLEEPGTPPGEILEEHREADRLHMDLQELVMKLRMVPVEPLFQQYARTVRDLTQASGKQARLILEGGDVEVDNSVLQLLREPLTHMVRNAVDHGIETLDERKAKGKNPVGRITLRANHVAGSIVIELEDDGAGLDRDKIVARARALGKLSEGEMPSDQELSRLVFEAGLSTAEEVSNLSGRGVGMDVVRRNIEALRGSVEVGSRPDEGTRVTIRLPLTLAIIDGLLVRISDQTFIVPLDSVVESLDLPAGARSNLEDSGVVTVRGRTLPWVRLRKIFGINGKPAPRENLVVVQLGEAEAGLVVDEVFGKSQTVIKPLAKLFHRLPGISGSAILGSGQVALILDVLGLLRREVERQFNGAGSAPEES
jgi:two-component system chemotaxis sensor kinase CheA